MSSSNESTAGARRVSPLRGVLQAAGWAPGSVDGVELSGGGAGPLGLADLSTCDRIGVKGRGAVAWLSAAGVVLPSQPNRLLERPDGLTDHPIHEARGGYRIALASRDAAANAVLVGPGDGELAPETGEAIVRHERRSSRASIGTRIKRPER